MFFEKLGLAVGLNRSSDGFREVKLLIEPTNCLFSKEFLVTIPPILENSLPCGKVLVRWENWSLTILREELPADEPDDERLDKSERWIPRLLQHTNSAVMTMAAKQRHPTPISNPSHHSYTVFKSILNFQKKKENRLTLLNRVEIENLTFLSLNIKK